MNNFFISLFFVIAAILAFVVMSQRETISYQKREIDYYNSTYLSKQGATSLWKGSNGKVVNYYLRSFDSGRNWYAITMSDSGTTILGPVEEIFPGLMKHLKDWDNLTDYVAKNGPINLNDGNGTSLLKDVGFEITTNK